MALENQISMYSVDTSNFYSAKEQKLHRKIMRLKVQRNKIKEVKDILKDYLLKAGFTEDNLKPIERGKYSSTEEFELFETVDPNKDKTQIQVKRITNRKGSYKILSQIQRRYILTSKIRCIKLRVSIFDEKPVYRLRYILKLPAKEIPSLDLEIVFNTYEYYCKLYRYKQIRVGETKQELLNFLKKKIEANEAAIDKHHTGKGKHHIRVLNEKTLSDKDVICVFESALNRYIGLKKDEFTESLMVVQVYFFDVFKDIEKYGFLYKGEKYRYFTSSAGQIRTKKAVFIKESVWNQLEKTLMCGLTIDAINAKGGNNVNKHLAYLALTNSATDLWKDFNIDECIVIDDFETNVPGLFDLIDDTDYSIKRIENVVPITHTDGAGMMLPEVSKKNFMVRLPWIKGLLGVFDFVSFIKERNASPLITDIYGKTWNVLEDGIKVIFTKSQFKMWKYYSSWQEYKDFYNKYGCTAGYCNKEEDRIKNSTINYQMLQTFTDFTDDEVKQLAAKSVEKIKNLTSSVDIIKEAFGVTLYNCNMSPLQKSIDIYPNLLNDDYLKDVIRSIKNSMVKKYRAGHLEVRGKYTFLLPDFYACCEHWFLGEEVPKGLLKDQEVYCRLFPNDEKLDCLRSPHLYKEHAVRKNMACKKLEDPDQLSRQELMKKWFNTDAIYTSSWDLISKILQFDVDGDKSLVIADKTVVQLAERNIQGIVPLYYNMRKAAPAIINNDSIYNGLVAAFTGGNIGMYSNDISKIWNSDIFVNGTEEEKQNAIDVVKLLCMENNFVIDFAKTLYKPTRPEAVHKKISVLTRKKLPAFFEYAKDKEPNQVAVINGTLVNKLRNIIPDIRLNFKKAGLGEIDYKLLMRRNSEETYNKKIIETYIELNRQYHFQINMEDPILGNYRYVAVKMRNELRKCITYNEEIDASISEDERNLSIDRTICDMLVYYLYGVKKAKAKESLWFCYGDLIYENLKSNLEFKEKKYIQCIDCGEWFEIDVKDTKACRCPECQKENDKINARLRKRKQRERKKDVTLAEPQKKPGIS